MAEIKTLELEATVGGLGDAPCRVRAFDVQEEVNAGLRGGVLLEVGEPVDAAALVGQPVHLQLSRGEGFEARHFHGVVTGAEVQEHPHGCWLALDVASRLHLLEVGREVRMFQRLSVPDVVREVLEAAGIPADAQDWRLGETYPEHAALRQHGESDSAFVRRLLAEEGISFAVRNAPDKEVLVFFDGPDGVEPVEGDPALADGAVTSLGAQTAWEVREVHALAPDAVMVRDYDPTRPALDLCADVEAEGARGCQVYVHAAGFSEPADGTRRARAALDAHRARARQVEGRSDCAALEPGRTVRLDSALHPDLTEPLLLVAVSHRCARGEGGAETYEATFRALPGARTVRPEPLPAPERPGVQVAFVAGPSGEELHGSERGEVRVRFPWDRSGLTDDRASPWLRVGQLPLGGSMVIPRVGFEVIVDQEQGDLDRPFVTGHLYNGEAPPPYALPGGATRSALQTATTQGGGGANELRFEDAAGAEELFLNASRDYTVSVENDAKEDVKVDETVEVGANRQCLVGANLNLKVGSDRTLTVGVNQSLAVKADVTDAVGGNASLTVGATRKLTVKGDLSETTTGALQRTVAALQSVTGLAGVQRKVVGDSAFTVGGAWLEVVANSRSTTCGRLRLETVGALKLVKATTVSVSCGAAYAMTAASETVDCGGDRTDDAGAALVLTAGGGLSIQADNINLTGETKVELDVGGTTLELTPTSVKLKSKSVKLDGVKALGSKASHKSN